ncbi:hypothetical protein [Streptomyces sp. T028]|uniref:hypothetical protein n=1 Tax=Streptomyces sp. T028 TaxID=3394379 RepID=UPI003A84121B
MTLAPGVARTVYSTPPLPDVPEYPECTFQSPATFRLIARLYAHFLDHVTGARSGTPHTRPHQVVIVDNDLPSLPAQLRRRMHTIELTRDNPLVP